MRSSSRWGLDKLPWQSVNDPIAARAQMIQWWGTSTRRRQHLDYWVRQPPRASIFYLTDGERRFVITDCRFDNEGGRPARLPCIPQPAVARGPPRHHHGPPPKAGTPAPTTAAPLGPTTPSTTRAPCTTCRDKVLAALVGGECRPAPELAPGCRSPTRCRGARMSRHHPWSPDRHRHPAATLQALAGCARALSRHQLCGALADVAKATGVLKALDRERDKRLHPGQPQRQAAFPAATCCCCSASPQRATAAERTPRPQIHLEGRCDARVP